MHRHGITRLSLALLLAGLASADGVLGQSASWVVYSNERFGFSIGYPADIFTPAGEPKEDSRYFVSADGKARLMVSASVNTTNETLLSYRAFVVRTSYSGARITYSRSDSRHFVLSGYKGDEIFYERVEMACRGRLVSGWQIVYPTVERGTYDAIVERMSRTWRPETPSACP